MSNGNCVLRDVDLISMEKRQSRDTWKSAILLGSVVCWTMGIIVTAMGLAMTQTNVFYPEVIEFLVPLYQSLMSAVGCGLLMSIAALVGCIGASCNLIKFLYFYLFALFGLFLYQMGNGAALIYYGNEILTVVQYVSIELCLGDFRPKNRTGRASIDHRERLEEVVARVAKSMKNQNTYENDDTYPASIRKIIEKYERDRYVIKCGPVKDYATPVGALLIFCCMANIFMGLATFMVIRAMNKENSPKTGNRNVQRKKLSARKGVTIAVSTNGVGARPRLPLYSSSTGTSLSHQPLTPNTPNTPKDIDGVNMVFGRESGDLRPIVTYHSTSSGAYGTPDATNPNSPSVSNVIPYTPNRVSADAKESLVFTFEIPLPSDARPRPRPRASQDISPNKESPRDPSASTQVQFVDPPTIKIESPTPNKDVEDNE